ncbi:hypothetical protein T09_3641 [Trichinella sp. T9]|nr:hypothetical protein T09_3641 [Trichinella sp. T9]
MQICESEENFTQRISPFFDVELELTSCLANNSMNENCFGKVTVKCARKPSAFAASQTVNIPVVKASTMREEVTIETQNTITKILFEWDNQHASGVFHKLVKVEGAQTVGIITTYDTTLVKKSCKVQAKYADVNDSYKVVSSPVKCEVQFVNNDLRQAEIIC